MRRTLRCTGCIATAALGLAVANSGLRAEEPPVREPGTSLQEAAEAAQAVAEEVVEEVQRAAGEAASQVAAEAQRAAEGAAREAAAAARELAEQARGKLSIIAPGPGYLLGLQITAVPRSLDAQLKLDGKGVLVDGVTKGGPAEKAGIQANDVLLSVDGEPLASTKELHKFIQAAEGKEINIKLLRGGEEQEFTVTPHKNELRGDTLNLQLDTLAPKREEVEIEIHKLETKIREKLKDAGLDVRMQLIRPGHFVSPQLGLQSAKTPDDVSILIRKKGEAPAEIEIKQGVQTWTATEDKLDELPDEVRPYAERMLSRGPAMFKLALPDRPEVPARPAPPRMKFTTPDGKTVTANSIEFTPQTPQTRERHRVNLEHRIEKLSSEIERVSEKMDNLRLELKAQAERGKE